MAAEEELNLAVLSDSAKRPRAPRDLPARLRVLAALLREAPADGAGPRLLWRDADGSVRALAIDRRLVIGRDAACDVVLAGPRVSRQHCVVRASQTGGGKIEIEDRGSSNGTMVNRVRLEDGCHVLKDGDVIEIGGVVMAVVNEWLSDRG